MKNPSYCKKGFLIRCHSVKPVSLWQGENSTYLMG